MSSHPDPCSRGSPTLCSAPPPPFFEEATDNFYHCVFFFVCPRTARHSFSCASPLPSLPCLLVQESSLAFRCVGGRQQFGRHCVRLAGPLANYLVSSVPKLTRCFLLVRVASSSRTADFRVNTSPHQPTSVSPPGATLSGSGLSRSSAIQVSCASCQCAGLRALQNPRVPCERSLASSLCWEL